MSYEDAPTLRPQLRAVLAQALEQRLGGAEADPDAAVVCPQPSTARQLDAVARVAVTGRRVLDLGAGVGDRSRAARRAGAALVDAVDEDEQALELARLLCVLQDVDRISCFAGDAGLASTYADEYDVVLAFGLLERIGPILPRIAQNLRGVLVTELPDQAPGPAPLALAETLPARAVLLEAAGDAPPIVACAAKRSTLRAHLAAGTPATDPASAATPAR